HLRGLRPRRRRGGGAGRAGHGRRRRGQPPAAAQLRAEHVAAREGRDTGHANLSSRRRRLEPRGRVRPRANRRRRRRRAADLRGQDPTLAVRRSRARGRPDRLAAARRRAQAQRGRRLRGRADRRLDADAGDAEEVGGAADRTGRRRKHLRAVVDRVVSLEVASTERRGVERGRGLAVVGALVVILVGLFWLFGRDRGGESGADESPGADGGAPELGAKKPIGATGLLDVEGLERGSIAGKVSDQNGAPLAGARVCARGVSGRLTHGRLQFPVCTRSGADGSYRIEGLLPARYGVGAFAPGYLPAAYAVVTSAGSRAREIGLAAGQHAKGIDLVLRS